MSPEKFVSLDTCTPFSITFLVNLLFSQPVITRQGGYENFHFQTTETCRSGQLLDSIFTVFDLHFYDIQMIYERKIEHRDKEQE